MINIFLLLDKTVYIWKTNFDEVDESLKKDASRVRYSIETPPEEDNNENVKPLQEKTTNAKVPETQDDTASEVAKLNTKLDMIMKTLVLMDKRLTLVEDQMRNKVTE